MSQKQTSQTHIENLKNIVGKTDEHLKLDNQLCFAAYACSREIIKRYRPFLDELGLTYTQYITMLVLWEQSPITAKALGDRLYLDSGTLTPLLKKLEKQGFVARKRDDVDERLLVVTLTEEGIALKQTVSEIPFKIACEVGLDVESGVALRESLKDLTMNMQSKRPEDDQKN